MKTTITAKSESHVIILDETPDATAEAGRVLDVRLGAPA